MKKSSIIYIVMLVISLISPVLTLPSFYYLDDLVSWIYFGYTAIGTATIIITFLKDKTSKHLALPLLSIFVLLIALTHLILGAYILAVHPMASLPREILLPLNLLFQIGLMAFAIHHILPQKIEDVELEAHETLEI